MHLADPNRLNVYNAAQCAIIDPIVSTWGSIPGIFPHNGGSIVRVTTVASVTDGMSNTISWIEDAGRPTLYIKGRPSQTNPNDGGVTPGTTTDGWGWADTEIMGFPDGSDPVGNQPGTGSGPWNGVINFTNDAEIYSFHIGGVHALMGDGSVRFLNENMSLGTLAALCTMNWGDVVSSYSYSVKAKIWG